MERRLAVVDLGLGAHPVSPALQVLVDADNVDPARVAALLDALRDADLLDEPTMTVAGRPAAVGSTDWPAYAVVVPTTGWQRADIALAAAYLPSAGALVLVSGDGDFGLLVTRHGGPVLVVSEAASGRLREGVTVVDPVVDGPDELRRWLAALR